MIKALVYLRVSTVKQAQQNESLEVQRGICIKKAINHGYKEAEIKVFGGADSGRKDDRDTLKEMFSYIENHPSQIEAVFIREIDRFSRGGSSSYNNLKSRLIKNNIQLIDSTGIIQFTQNTLSDLGFEYDWSIFAPSQMAENIMADSAQDDVRRILTRTVGQQIILTNKGYWMREAPIGYKNAKIEDEEGKKRSILIPHEEEAEWIIQIFKMRAEGQSDLEICKVVNAMGFRTRKRKRRDQKTGRSIGEMGKKKLTRKIIQKYICKPIYAGIIMEKWTKNQAVKGAFDGLINIELFNKANRGKISISDQKGILLVEYDSEVKRRSKNNPLYPYKRVVLCPICKKEFKGSASTGKSGKRFPAYHCDRNHKNFRIPIKEFDKVVANSIKKIKFKPEFLKLFEEVVMDVWEEKHVEALQLTRKSGENVVDLQRRQERLIDQFTQTDNSTIKKRLESQIDELETEIASAQDVRNKNEIDKDMVRLYLAHARNLIEHPEKLLLKANHIDELQQIWSFVFSELPTYNDLVNRTPKLTLVFEQTSKKRLKKSQLVAPRGIEPRLPE